MELGGGECMTRREFNKMGGDLRRRDRKDKLTALGYVVAVFIGLPVFMVLLWVVLELASKP